MSCKCVRQSIRKFHILATKPSASRIPKVTERQKQLIKLQQIRNDTLSLNEFVRFVRSDLNSTISGQNISCILRDFDMVSYIVPKKPRIPRAQRRTRVDWCYEYLSWSVNDWLKDESNYEILNRENRIYIRRFRHDPTRFERSQQRVHRRGAIINVLDKLIYSRLND